MPRRLVIVSGLSGAGRTIALAVLSDLGFQASDAVPPKLWPALLDASPDQDLALGWPLSRRSDDPLPAFPDDTTVTHLFLSADTETLRRRYNETRRVHPFDDGRGLMAAIEAEEQAALSRRALADEVRDTTGVKLADFRASVAALFEPGHSAFQICVQSFSYRMGLPAEADMVFDVRWLRNPYYNLDLRPKTGQDPAVGDYIRDDTGFADFESHLRALLSLITKRQVKEGKAYFTIAFGCTGGKHRSVYIAEAASSWLREAGCTVRTVHRDMSTF